MNKLKKVLLLILFVFIIAIVVIIALNKTNVVSETTEITESEVLASTTTSFTSSTKSVNSTDSFTDTASVLGESYSYNSDGYGLLSSSWWVLCSSQGQSMKSVTLYFDSVKEDSKQVTPAEAYILATLSSTNSGKYRDEGQIAWWNAGSGTGGAITATFSYSDPEWEDIENFLSGRSSSFSLANFSISADDLNDGGDLETYLEFILDVMASDSDSGYESRLVGRKETKKGCCICNSIRSKYIFFIRNYRD